MTGRNLDRWCALWHQVHRRSHWGFETSLVLRWLPDIGHFFEYIFMSCTSDNFFIYSELRSCGRKTLPYSPVPWYLLLDKSHFSLSSFNTTALGRFITGKHGKICFIQMLHWHCDLSLLQVSWENPWFWVQKFFRLWGFHEFSFALPWNLVD